MEANRCGSAEIENVGELLKPQSARKMHVGPVEDDGLVLSSTLFLDYVGEVAVTLNSSGLSWKPTDDSLADTSTCLGIQFSHKGLPEIKFSEIYAVELTSWCLVHECSLPSTGRCLLSCVSEMHRFVVHGFKRSKTAFSLDSGIIYFWS